MKSFDDHNLRSEGGFTLVELLVVIVILGILIAIAVPTFLNQQDKANDASAQTALNTTYKDAKAISVDYDGQFTGGRKADGSGTYDATELAAAIQGSEPELTVTTTAKDAASLDPTSLTTGTVYITSATSGRNLEAVVMSKSGNICKLEVANESPVITCVPPNPAPAPPSTADSLAAMATTDSFLGAPAGSSNVAPGSNWPIANFGGTPRSGTLYNTASYKGYTGVTGGVANYWNAQFDGSGAGGDAVQISIWRALPSGQSVILWLNMPSPPAGSGAYSGYQLRISGTATPGTYQLVLNKFANGVQGANDYNSLVPLKSTYTDGVAGTVGLVYKAGVVSIYTGTDGAGFTDLFDWTDNEGAPFTHGYAGIKGNGGGWAVVNFKAGPLPG